MPETIEKITVKVGAFPGGQIRPYSLPKGADYAACLKEADLKVAKDLDVRVNGLSLSSLAAEANDGDQVLVFSKVRGN